jgi:hypothetical protein
MRRQLVEQHVESGIDQRLQHRLYVGDHDHPRADGL